MRERRGQQVIRQWQILKILEQQFLTRGELARTFGVTFNTIKRDLLQLEEAGFPLYDDDEQRWHLARRNSAPRRVERVAGAEIGGAL